MEAKNVLDTSLALAGASFVAIVSGLSVNSYDFPLIVGIAILCVATPLLVGFARWIPPDIGPNSTWHDWLASPLFLVAWPAAILGMSFLFAHVHIIGGILFAASSIITFCLYCRYITK
jgi:hypothetical protein